MADGVVLEIEGRARGGQYNRDKQADQELGGLQIFENFPDDDRF